MSKRTQAVWLLRWSPSFAEHSVRGYTTFCALPGELGSELTAEGRATHASVARVLEGMHWLADRQGTGGPHGRLGSAVRRADAPSRPRPEPSEQQHGFQ